MAKIDEFLEEVLKRDGSDLHFMAGDPPRVRQYGKLSNLRAERLSADFVREAIYEIMPRKALDRFETRDGTDFAYTLGTLARFRVNALRQLNGMGSVFRAIPSKAQTLEQLRMPEAVRNLAKVSNGLILVTGKTGSGKSTTLAAMIDDINSRIKGHILTIEDPIEFVHPRKNCLISQREVGVHAESFALALLSALREDPDVILVGELRDLETISLALTAAETGHCVLATLHTDSAIRTINRMIGVFPSDQQAQVRTMLSESLRAVVSQRLLPTADGQGRVAALETLVVSRAVANLIRENKTFQIHSVLQTGAAQGMRLLDHSLRELVQSGAVTRETALRHCEDPKVLGG